MNRIGDRGLDFDSILRTVSNSNFGPSTSPTINITVNQYYDSTDRYNKLKGDDKMKFPVILSKDEDGYFIAECPSLPGCVTQGETREEAIDNIKEAIELHRELRLDMGLPEFEETIEVEV